MPKKKSAKARPDADTSAAKEPADGTSAETVAVETHQAGVETLTDSSRKEPVDGTSAETVAANSPHQEGAVATASADSPKENALKQQEDTGAVVKQEDADGNRRPLNLRERAEAAARAVQKKAAGDEDRDRTKVAEAAAGSSIGSVPAEGLGAHGIPIPKLALGKIKTINAEEVVVVHLYLCVLSVMCCVYCTCLCAVFVCVLCMRCVRVFVCTCFRLCMLSTHTCLISACAGVFATNGRECQRNSIYAAHGKKSYCRPNEQMGRPPPIPEKNIPRHRRQSR